MDEYIKKKPLIEEISSLSVTLCGSEIFGKLAKHSVVKMIYEQPVADVVEVRHGEWEWFEEWIPSTPDNVRECEDCGWRCSECKTALADAVGGYWDNPDEEPELNFCPICSAKMDGKRKDGAE